MDPTTVKEESRFQARSSFLGGRVATRELEGWPAIATSPLTFPGRKRGFFVLLRFGALVAVDTDPAEAAEVLEHVRSRSEDAHPVRAEETAEVHIVPGAPEGVLPDGEVQLRLLDADRAQVIANVLSKSAALTYYEERVAAVFDQVEALATQLRDTTVPTSGRDILRQIGEALLIQTHMVGRVEVGEKPEITWEDAELDRLYARLALEYELVDRDRALSRKLALISDVASTYLELLDTRKSQRLEWYIIILIAVEIVIIVWDIFGTL